MQCPLRDPITDHVRWMNFYLICSGQSPCLLCVIYLQLATDIVQFREGGVGMVIVSRNHYELNGQRVSYTLLQLFDPKSLNPAKKNYQEVTRFLKHLKVVKSYVVFHSNSGFEITIDIRKQDQ